MELSDNERIRRFVGLIITLFLVSSSHHDALLSQLAQQGTQSVTSMYTGADGLTHFRRIEIPYNLPIQLKGGVVFGRHELEARGTPRHLGNAPHRRYVVTLSGAAKIVGSSGEVFIADPRHILLAEDLTGKGHSTQAVGPGDWVRMFLEIDDPRTRDDRK